MSTVLAFIVALALGLPLTVGVLAAVALLGDGPTDRLGWLLSVAVEPFRRSCCHSTPDEQHGQRGDAAAGLGKRRFPRWESHQRGGGASLGRTQRGHWTPRR